MADEQTTEELKALQVEKETAEHRLAKTASDESEAAQHSRRAEKASYLRQKLDERAESEREGASSDDRPGGGDRDG